GDAKMKEAAGFFWDVVTKDRSYVIGGNSDGEHFSPKERLSAFLSPTTAETCNTYNMLKLTRHLFEWDPKVEYADYYERALYNHILASQNPETGMMCYYVPLSSGSSKRYSSPDDSFWCCTGTGVENHSKYGDSIYFHHGANSLYVNLFIASTLSWKQRGVVITQHTGFPDETATHLSFECRAPERFTLLIRHPSWAGPGFKIEVNECAGQESSRPGSYAEISRTWRSGDRVDISLPMQLHTEGFKDNPNRLAFLDGPIVLCAAVSSRRSVPVIVSPENELLSGVKPEAGQPLSFNADSSEFHLEGAARNGNLKMTPFYAMTGHDYAVYYDVLTPAQWRKREEDNRAELARQAEMAAREVDVVTPGDEASETAHKLAGERTESGDLDDRQWRDARYGGWFSYELKVLPGADQELDCAYWGSDRGRVFDILVDGQQIATQRLDENHPGIFFDAVYPLPAALLQGKQTVTVRFQARPRGMAGGLFGCRILKKVAAARVP
ncbi:MAG TPA: beta-L-arabinofuranosidase domain-containing protein, partial [Chthonomonadales bacterium]|nr:beta-L-arabinofuranosidase domain-containing protein [Chthonomonadales bacterium]